MVGLPEDTELSGSPSFSFLNVSMSVTITQTNQNTVFLLNQQDETKQVIHAILTYKDYFSNYLKYFFDDVDNEAIKKFDFFAHKNVKYLFYKFNDYLHFNRLNTFPVRHSKIN